MGWSSNGATSPYNTMGNGNTSYSPVPLSANSSNGGFNEMDLDALATTPQVVDPNLKQLRPKNLIEKARLNVA
jgi:hypothetical protein